MSKMGKRSARKPSDNMSGEDMAIMHRVMEKDWVALCALALGDQFPALDAAARVKMAEEQKARRQSDT